MLLTAPTIPDLVATCQASRTALHPRALLPPLWEKGEFGRPDAPLPLIPPTPFCHKVRRGSLGILVAETGDDTQGLAKTSTSCKEQSALRCSHIGYVNDKQPAYNQGGYG
jgi:hypothetical protein